MKRLACLLVVLCAACSSAPASPPDAGPPPVYGKKPIDAGTPPPVDDGGLACEQGNQPSTTYPGAHPKLPLLVSAGGPVLAHPKLVPIVFVGDARATDIGAFMSAVGTSSYWTSVASEYGVGAATSSAPISVNETPPTVIDDATIQTWLADRLDGTHAGFGIADPNAIYVLYYPATTSISAVVEQSCLEFLGYHSETKVGATDIAYAVIASCPGVKASMTGVTSHELFEAATDPHPITAPAYNQIDDTTNGFYWDGHMEIGDLCESYPEQTPADVGYPVVPVWSNAASAAGRLACVPNDGAPNFRTMPDTEALTLAPGESTTIHLLAFSDQPTAPWTVTVQQSAPTWADTVTISLCRSTAQNGETIPLTIARPIVAANKTVVHIVSTLGAATTSASFTVGE